MLFINHRLLSNNTKNEINLSTLYVNTVQITVVELNYAIVKTLRQ